MTRNTRVDTTLSAIITEAGAFPPEATTPSKDEQRSAVYPLRVYDGFNYLPTYYGYKSYFGLDSTLDASGLPANVVVEDIFVYQARDYSNIVMALTSHGIYMRSGTQWLQLLALTPPPEGTSIFWSKVTINQLLFIYRQGAEEVYVVEDIIDGAGVYMDVFNGMKVKPTRKDSLTGQAIQLFSFVPTTLNMEGQVGIYAAGGSLGFWDSDDSVSWSAISDYTDFTPSLTTLANLVKLQDQVGRITTIAPHGDGYIVYCTRSVILMQATTDSLLRFQSTVVLGSVGVTYPREVAVAQPNTTHYAWTNMGLLQIEDGKAQPIVPDFSDHVSQMRTPQYLKMLNNRYLCIGVMDPNFIPGNIEQSAVTVDPGDFRFEGITVPGLTIPGQTIPGNEVCFTIPEYDYNPKPPVWEDPNDVPDPTDPTYPGTPNYEKIADAGIKPYHVLQFYAQWLYKGATITNKTVKLGSDSLQAFTINPGSTDGKYQKIPVAMSAADVPEFNANTQLDAMKARQVAVYEAEYSEDRLQIQKKWDDYIAIRDATGGFLEIIGEETVKVTQPQVAPYIGERWDNQPLNRRALNDYDGNMFRADDGNLYVSSTSSYYSNRFRTLSLREIINALPDKRDWLIAFEQLYSYPQYPFQALGKVGDIPLTYDIRQGNSTHPFVHTALLDSNAPIPYRFDNQEKDSLQEPFMLIEPGSLQNHELLMTGPGLTYKVLPTKATGVEIAESYAVQPHKLLRPVPSKVKLAFVFRPEGVWQSNPYPEDRDIVVTVTKRRGFDGNWVDSTEEVIPWPEFSVQGLDTTITVAEHLNAEEAALEYHIKINNLRAAIRDNVEAQEDAWLEANVRSVYVDEPRPPRGDNTTIYTTYSWWGGVRKSSWSEIREVYAEFPALLVRETRITETDKSLLEDLYGAAPPVLPGDKVGATAERALTDEDKRGLVSVSQHFYSNNNKQKELDSSFLITAAGRVDVPLGTPLGDPKANSYPSRFKEKADWANRYYTFEYKQLPPEDGWPEEERWPPESNDRHDPLTPFPPTDTRGWEQVGQSVVCGVTNDIIIEGVDIAPIVYPPWTIENPPLTWVLENGSIAPYNPTMFGAYVYDLHLQKWGVFKGNYKHLVDYQAINNYNPGAIPYKNFLIDGGCLTEDLEIALFNDYPTDNFIKYGKYQHIGSDFCALEEVKVDFRTESTGLIAVQFSLDGRQPEYGHTVAQWFKQSLSHTLNCDIVGKWATISLTGHYDLSAMQIKSNPAGRR